jgi:hypothetical protein
MAQQPRTVQPGDAQDERLAGVPLSAAYTYAYLPTVLDDSGRAKDQPAVLNGYLWPLRADEHDTQAMAADLESLADAGLICRYTVGERAYLHDPGWRTRQRIGRPEPSTIPSCPTHETGMDDIVGDTLRKLSDQFGSFVGSAASSFDEAKVRDAVSRAVEDVTFMIDPEKAAAFGQKVREFLGETSNRPLEPESERGPEPESGPENEQDTELGDGDVWHEVTDRPNGHQ